MSLFHTHIWKVTKVENLTRYWFRNNRKFEEPLSYIHRVCSLCQEVETEEQGGTYSIDEFN